MELEKYLDILQREANNWRTVDSDTCFHFTTKEFSALLCEYSEDGISSDGIFLEIDDFVSVEDDILTNHYTEDDSEYEQIRSLYELARQYSSPESRVKKITVSA
jgi:hypothetical protein